MTKGAFSNSSTSKFARIAVVIPCYRTGERTLEVLSAIPEMADMIYCVDDGCPDGTGAKIEAATRDPRVRVLKHKQNQGVGAATITGYRAAIADGAEVVVKIDGDGQMDPTDLHRFVMPLVEGRADYTKGNRFFRLEDVREMPALRLIGNAVLTFFTKLSTGYWNIFDPTNGYTAIHVGILRTLPLDRISQGYFFESDMLFRLGTIRAVVLDVPMTARYGNEKSNLRISKVVRPFLCSHIGNTIKRIFYSYYLRDFQVASVEILLGFLFMGFGIIFGGLAWANSATNDQITPAGTVMLAALPIIIGFQMLLAALNYDIGNTPDKVLHKELLGRLIDQSITSCETQTDKSDTASL